MKIIINENQFDILKEALTDKVYHYTSLNNMLRVCKTNEIVLSTSIGTDADAPKYRKENFFLSLTRNKSNKTGYAYKFSNFGARIEFNGQSLSQRYHGEPFDYWGDTMGKQAYVKDMVNYKQTFNSNKPTQYQTQNRTEAEDRIYSHDDTIPNVSKYITRIDILINENFKDKDILEEQCRYAYYISISDLSSKVFIYNNSNDFNKQSNNIINSEIKEMFGYKGKYSTEFKSYYENETPQLITNLKNIIAYILFRNSDNVNRDIANIMNSYGLKNLLNGDFINDIKHRLKNRGVQSIFNNAEISALSSKNKEENRIPLRIIADYFKKNKVTSFQDMNKLKLSS